MMPTYDVALWRLWPSLFPDQVGYIQTSSPLLAVQTLMRLHRLEEVAHAAACVLDEAHIERWDYLYIPLVMEEEEVTI